MTIASDTTKHKLRAGWKEKIGLSRRIEILPVLLFDKTLSSQVLNFWANISIHCILLGFGLTPTEFSTL
jgi:hypothetical protein